MHLSGQIFFFPWKSTGLCPRKYDSHFDYLESFNAAAVTWLRWVILRIWTDTFKKFNRFQWRIYIDKFWTRALGPFFFHFHAVVKKIWPNNALAPPSGLVTPLLANPGSAARVPGHIQIIFYYL